MNKANAEFLKLNPNGLVPTIDDQGTDNHSTCDGNTNAGFILWESNAIMRYFVHKYAANHSHELFPEDPQIRAEADKWMDWCSTTSMPQYRIIECNLCYSCT